MKFEDEPSRILGNKEVREYNISISMLQKHILHRIFHVVDLILLSSYVLVLGIFQFYVLYLKITYIVYMNTKIMSTLTKCDMSNSEVAIHQMGFPKSVSIRKRKKGDGSFFSFPLTRKIYNFLTMTKILI